MTDPDSQLLWQRVETLFLGALQQPETRRLAWLKAELTRPEYAAEKNNTGIIEAVTRLLKADANAGRRLEDSIGRVAAEAIDKSPRASAQAATPAAGEVQQRPTIGSDIGPYRLVSELGHGGMSTVYLATRSDAQFEHEVAIKFVRHELASPELGRRLIAERQILARLTHPNIARLFDGGTTEDGLPYFVMEVILGLPIDQYCDRLRLNVAARLRLFRKVCHAVHYAHSNLVVHRDIKPSNVLVTEDGEPKLLDFGIAKLLDAEADAVTQSHLRMGTPGYSSPEQILGHPITTASDVYSLGVLLYRLLTGSTPYGQESSPLILPAEEARRDRPPPPSHAVRQTTLAEAQLRGERPDGWWRRLQGDLDNIVLMALRREPQRRYGSAQQLAEDLDRHLEAHPVIARPDTFAYRTAKFMQRHRWAVAGVASVVVLVLLFGLTLVSQQARTSQQRDRAERVSAMLVSLFKAVGPTAGRGSVLTARQLLDQGRNELASLDDQPETQALLRHTLGGLYEQLGAFGEARALFTQALEQRRLLHGDRHEAVAESLHHLAQATARDGHYDDAEPLFRAALDIRRRLLGEDHPLVAISLNGLALVLHEQGDYAAAAPLYRHAIEQSARLLGETNAQTVKTRGNLALLLLDQGNYGEAESLFRKASEGWRQRHAQEELIAEILDGLAQALTAQGNHAEAESKASEALALRASLYDEEHPLIARSHAHMANILRDSDPQKALLLAQQALDIRRRMLGEDNAETGESLSILAGIQLRLGHRVEAEALYRRAIAIYANSLSANHPLAQRPVAELGTLLAELDRCPAALPLLRAAAKYLPNLDQRMADVRLHLARCQAR